MVKSYNSHGFRELCGLFEDFISVVALINRLKNLIENKICFLSLLPCVRPCPLSSQSPNNYDVIEGD